MTIQESDDWAASSLKHAADSLQAAHERAEKAEAMVRELEQCVENMRKNLLAAERNGAKQVSRIAELEAAIEKHRDAEMDSGDMTIGQALSEIGTFVSENDNALYSVLEDGLA